MVLWFLLCRSLWDCYLAGQPPEFQQFTTPYVHPQKQPHYFPWRSSSAVLARRTYQTQVLVINTLESAAKEVINIVVSP